MAYHSPYWYLLTSRPARTQEEVIAGYIGDDLPETPCDACKKPVQEVGNIYCDECAVDLGEDYKEVW